MKSNQKRIQLEINWSFQRQLLYIAPKICLWCWKIYWFKKIKIVKVVKHFIFLGIFFRFFIFSIVIYLAFLLLFSRFFGKIRFFILVQQCLFPKDFFLHKRSCSSITEVMKGCISFPWGQKSPRCLNYALFLLPAP